jgi:hypothetical protein
MSYHSYSTRSRLIRPHLQQSQPPLYLTASLSFSVLACGRLRGTRLSSTGATRREASTRTSTGLGTSTFAASLAGSYRNARRTSSSLASATRSFHSNSCRLYSTSFLARQASSTSFSLQAAIVGRMSITRRSHSTRSEGPSDSNEDIGTSTSSAPGQSPSPVVGPATTSSSSSSTSAQSHNQAKPSHSHDHSHGDHDHNHDHDHDHSHSHGLFHSHAGHDHSQGTEQLIKAISSGQIDRGTRITLLGLGSNVALTISKGLAGLWMNSASLLAEAGHSLSDLLGVSEREFYQQFIGIAKTALGPLALI